MSYDVLEKKIDLLPVHYQQEVIPQMSSFEKFRCAFGYVPSA